MCLEDFFLEKKYVIQLKFLLVDLVWVCQFVVQSDLAPTMSFWISSALDRSLYW